MIANISIRLSIAASIIGWLISACQPVLEQYPISTSSSNVTIPTDENLPDINGAVPISSAIDTSTNDPSSMPSHVPAEVPETSLTTIEIASIVPPAAPTIPKFYPANTMGWQKQELINILGQADYIRRDGAGEVHQYKLESCIVDFTLYPVNGRVEIIAWHGRSRIQNQNINATACYQDLASRKISH
ncbi:MAG: hypothetical protein ACPIDZ_03255 [Candidatus Puniceispirillales bacterium]